MNLHIKPIEKDFFRYGIRAGLISFISSVAILGTFSFIYTKESLYLSVFSLEFWINFIGTFLITDIPLFFIWLIVAAVFSSLFIPKDLERSKQSSLFVRNIIVSFAFLIIATILFVIFPTIVFILFAYLKSLFN